MCLMVCLYNTDQLTMRNLPNKESYLMEKKYLGYDVPLLVLHKKKVQRKITYLTDWSHVKK